LLAANEVVDQVFLDAARDVVWVVLAVVLAVVLFTMPLLNAFASSTMALLSGQAGWCVLGFIEPEFRRLLVFRHAVFVPCLS
jgi:hypothetical protein